MSAYDYAIAWAGMVMLFDFSMWAGGVLEFYYNIIYKLPKFLAKPLGTCKVCFCFWFGSIGWVLSFGFSDEYFLFIGLSEMIIILYSWLALFYKLFSNK